MSPREAGSALGALGGLIVMALVLVFVSVIVTIVIAFGIWPGELTLTAPIVCPEDRPDAFVVSDTVSPAPGESSTTYTVICLGPDGEQTNAGLLRPFVLVALAHGALLVGLGVVVVVLQRVLR